jgi:hypothetical protein
MQCLCIPGRIVDGDGNVIVDSLGVFRFSRRAAPFGFNGRHLYASLRYDFLARETFDPACGLRSAGPRVRWINGRSTRILESSLVR